MASGIEYNEIFSGRGFIHPRSKSLPELPPNYDWEIQIKKYCPTYHYDKAKAIGTEAKEFDEETIKNQRFYKLKSFSTFRRRPVLPTLESQTPVSQNRAKDRFDALSGVFCHRGLYDRCMKIPENSLSAIENGISQGLLLHELDARLGQHLGQTFLAHDESAIRVTSKTDRWSLFDFVEIMETHLVTRRFDPAKNDFASSFSEKQEKVSNVDHLLAKYNSPNSEKGCTFQLDLRGDDFPRAIVWFHLRKSSEPMLLLKGYNLTFPHGNVLRQAIRSIAASEFNLTLDWTQFSLFTMPIIMVFYSEPIIRLALLAKGQDPDSASQEDRLSLDYEHLLNTTINHIYSFRGIFGSGFSDFIPEIVYSGLGLRYNVQTGQAVNPLDGSAITEPEVILESRVDRAMIQASLVLRQRYPYLMFSSCTRLCEVRTTHGELVADMKTGRLKPKLSGQKGISAKLKSIHGGLYPQSRIVVADDPFAEIAARTWIDEYANLDRTQLLSTSYSDWLALAEPAVAAAVNKLNGPFLANTFQGPLDGWDIKVEGRDEIPVGSF